MAVTTAAEELSRSAYQNRISARPVRAAPQIGREPNRLDILTSIDGVEFDEAWRDRVIARIEGLQVPILGLERMIRNKRAVGRPRDLADVDALETEAAKRRREPG